jgi:hypothetical protein
MLYPVACKEVEDEMDLNVNGDAADDSSDTGSKHRSDLQSSLGAQLDLLEEH